MKRIALYTSMLTSLLFALVGCTMDNESLSASKNGIIAVIGEGKIDTRATMADNPGIKLQSFWSANDCIGIFGDNAKNIQFKVNEADITEGGTTALFRTTNGNMPEGTLYAYYPYSSNVTSGSKEGTFTIDFPSTQTCSLKYGMPQADPKASIMLAKGTRSSGLSFRNAMAVIKTGMLFEDTTRIRSVEFHDLSDKAVSGTMTIDWNDGNPMTSLSGTNSKITLDCGEGVMTYPERATPFLIIVPARTYSKGFEITFVDDKGNRTSRSVGTTMGKTLNRSTVYTVGDIGKMDMNIEGASSVLNPNTILMTPEALDKVKIIESHMNTVYGEDGERLYDFNRHGVSMPIYHMIVNKDLNPKEGGWLVFTSPSDDLPSGGVYRITSCHKIDNGNYDVEAAPETDPFKAYDEIHIGKPMFDEAGNYLEDGGVEIDINDYIANILDENGNPVDWSQTKNGELQFSEEAIEQIMGGTVTRAYHSKSYTTPQFNININKDDAYEVANNLNVGANAKLGASMTFNTKLALGKFDGELQYLALGITPVLNYSADFSLKLEGNIESKRFHVFTIYTIPVLVAPGVAVYFEIKVTAYVGVGGNIVFTTSFSGKKKFGEHFIRYNKGDGFIYSSKEPEPEETAPNYDLDYSLEGSIYAYGAVGFNFGISICALCHLGLQCDAKLTLKYAAGEYHSKKITLQPDITIVPMVGFVGWAHQFKEFTASIDFDPLYEKYIVPKIKSPECVSQYRFASDGYKDIYALVEFEGDTCLYLPTTGVSVNGLVELEGECDSEITVAIAVYGGGAIKWYQGRETVRSIFENTAVPQAAIPTNGVPMLSWRYPMLPSPSYYPWYEGGTIIEKLEIGTFPANEAGPIVINGSADNTILSIPSGNERGVGLVFIKDDKIIYATSPEGVLYYWPYDAYGRPYVWYDDKKK